MAGLRLNIDLNLTLPMQHVGEWLSILCEGSGLQAILNHCFCHFFAILSSHFFQKGFVHVANMHMQKASNLFGSHYLLTD